MDPIGNADREAVLADGAVKPIKLAHIVLRTTQLLAMRDFYLLFLNAEVAHENAMACFLRYDEEHHRLVLLAMPELSPVDPHASGLEHYAFTYSSMGALLANYVRLKIVGIHPDWCINHGITTSIYYRDPDGNQIETQIDNMSNDEADAFMRSDYFAQNPVGVDFDPDLLLKRYRNGDPLSQLTQFGAAPYANAEDRLLPACIPPYDWQGSLL